MDGVEAPLITAALVAMVPLESALKLTIANSLTVIAGRFSFKASWEKVVSEEKR